MDFKIYLDTEYRSISSITGGKLDQLYSQEWYVEPNLKQNTINVAYASTVVNGRWVYALIYYQNVWDPYLPVLQRVATVAQNVEDLKREIYMVNGQYYLISPDVTVISSNCAEAAGKTLSEVLTTMELNEAQLKNDTMLKVDSAEYYVRFEEFIPDNAGLQRGWRILYLSDYTGIIREIRAQILDSVWICVLIAVGALAATLCVANNITSRLNMLMNKIEALGEGDFSVKINIPGRDEISRISDGFDQMSDRIYQLIQEKARSYEEKVAYERRQKELLVSWRDSEYQVLRGQINPHYLFNTLENIRMSMLVEGERESSRIMRIFSETMREYMDVDRLYTTLREELHFLNYYVEILHFRMGRRLQYLEDVPEDLLEMEVPRLILQPLVENAISHGIDPKPEGGTVLVEIRQEKEYLTIRVKEDGIGMTDEQLQLLREHLNVEPERGRHLGLYNIRRRLMLLFGDNRCLTIDSEQNCGSVVTIHLPIFKKGEN